MAIAIDGSTPIRWTGTPNQDVDLPSASFTAPTGAMLVVCVSSDSISSTDLAVAVSDSGGLAWTNRKDRDWDAGVSPGHASIWTATTTSAVARTVSVRHTNEATTIRMSVKCYVVTGQHASPIGQTGEGSSTNDSIIPTLFTSTANNSFAFVCATDWNARGAPTSSDLTVDADTFAGVISVVSGFKDCGTAGSETANLNGGGTLNDKDWNWVALEIIAASTATGGAKIGGTIFVPTEWPTRGLRTAKAYPPGGVTYDVSQSDAATATDTFSVTAVFSSTLTEAGTATDTPTAAWVTSSSVTEAATATDTPSASAVFTSALTESGAAADAVSTTAVFAATLTEAGSAAETLTAAAVLNDTITEAGSATELIDGSIEGAVAVSRLPIQGVG